VRTSLITRPLCQLHTDPRKDCQLAGPPKNGRRALLLGGLPFHKAVHPFFELIAIDTQVFTNPVSSRVSSPRGIAPRGSRRTVREPLNSYSSRHGATPRPHLPVSEQRRSATRESRDPLGRPTKMVPQLLVFPGGPEDQISVQFAHRRVKRRAIISPVVLEPALDNRIEHPRQILDRFITALRQLPATKVLAKLKNLPLLVGTRPGAALAVETSYLVDLQKSFGRSKRTRFTNAVEHRIPDGRNAGSLFGSATNPEIAHIHALYARPIRRGPRWRGLQRIRLRQLHAQTAAANGAQTDRSSRRSPNYPANAQLDVPRVA